jgi:hypothetical protein
MSLLGGPMPRVLELTAADAVQSVVAQPRVFERDPSVPWSPRWRCDRVTSMRAVLLCLLAVAAVLWGSSPAQASADHCPCAEAHEQEGTDCCLPGPEQCACGLAQLVAVPSLPLLTSRPAPMALALSAACAPAALHTLPRPPPPLPPPIG